jgi:hypothetical protein
VTRRVILAMVLACVLAGCGSVPRPRGDMELKQSADKSEVDAILERYREVRNTAIALVDHKPLSIVEGGPMLAIDTGQFEVAQRLSRTQGEEGRRLQVRSIETPSLARYPLWFMVSAYDPAAKLDVAQIFERTTPVDPWLLVAGPQLVPTTPLPGLRHDGDGKAIAVSAKNGKGMSMSPQQAAAEYAKALGSYSGKNPAVVRDGFLRQMRTAFDQVNQLEGVTMTQKWAPETVKHALRTDDGGALVWVTFLRLDTYSVDPGIKVTWPDGSPQKAFLADGISGSGKLRYYYQVLLRLPGGSGEPLAIGQYGGVISADSHPNLAPLPVPNIGSPSEPFPGVTLTPTPAAPGATTPILSPDGISLRDRLKKQKTRDTDE